ncbi:MAG TPA: CHASE3 domain-containing protein [Rubrivivax sp.]
MNVLTIARRNPWVLLMAFIGAAAMVFISEGSYWQSVDLLDDQGEMAAARLNIQRLERSLVDAETGQRGYLLTSSKDYLRPYDKALTDINASFVFLDSHYSVQPEAASLLQRLRALSDTRLSELALTIRLHDEGQREASTDRVRSGIEKEHMVAIRSTAEALLELESQKVSAGRQLIYRTLQISRVGVAVLSCVMLAALMMYLLKSLALVRTQSQQQQLVQAERDRLEIEVAQRTGELTELTRHLLTAREDERHRLARDLHDELGALLTSAKLDAARIKSRLAGAPETLERLAELVGKLNEGIALGRRIIEDLRPSTLGHFGLEATLEILARGFAQQTGIEVVTSLEPVHVGATRELVLYRVAQEAITNISKYANARRVSVTLAAHGGRVELTVQDDGAGFDSQARPRSAYGLVGMRFRVEAEGGVLTVVSAPGQGTAIKATLPTQDDSAD